jgi:hypothetical protein
LYFHRLLEETIEQLATMPRSPAVESERELVQVIVQMLPTHSPLMRAEQPAFQQRGYAVDTRQKLRGRFVCPGQNRDLRSRAEIT